MAIPINTSNEIGTIITYLTYNITGDLFLSLICFVLVVIALALAFRIPIEWTALIVFPFLLAMASWTSQFLPIIGAGIFLLAILLAKNWWYAG